MVNLRVIQLAPRGYFLTPIKAQTIYGQLVWLIATKQGEEKARAYIELMKEKPFFILSDAFPFGAFPVFHMLDEKSDNPRKYGEAQRFRDYKKQFKRLRYVNIVDIDYMVDKNQLFVDYEAENKIDSYLKRNLPIGFYIHNRIGNIIDRRTSSTSIGGVLSYKQYYVRDISGRNRLWMFVSVLDKDLYLDFQIEELLKELFTQWGFSKRRNVGFGFYDFNVGDIQEVVGSELDIHSASVVDKIYHGLTEVENAHLVASLSDFVPSPNEHKVDKGGWHIDVKYGKYSDFVQQHSNVRFFKLPILTLGAGSIVGVKSPRGYLGRVIDITPKQVVEQNNHQEHTYTMAYAFYYGLPFNIESLSCINE